MNIDTQLFGEIERPKRQLKKYLDVLTVDINRKGVLDIDVVKGCTAGIAAHGSKGCYQACYAASTAKYMGIDFSKSVVRKVHTTTQAKQIENAVKNSPLGFFRIGTMGDPCHAWEETVKTVEWLAPYAIPVIITKHWKKASDSQLLRLIKCGTVINTSVSAIDSNAHLSRRIGEIKRYSDLGGESITRVVSCDFNLDDPIANKMNSIQEMLFSMKPVIDNPLRIPMNHYLVTSGLVKVRKVKDLTAIRTISIHPESETYLGHCSGCADLCGAGLISKPDVRPQESKQSLFKKQ